MSNQIKDRAIQDPAETKDKALELLQELLEICPPGTTDKFWWPDGLPKLIKKVDELIDKSN